MDAHRRGILVRLTAVGLALAAVPFAGAEAQVNASVVRLASVTTVRDGGLLDELLTDFQKQSGYTVEVYIGEDVYFRAREGRADIVFSHLGHHDARPFLLDGFGQWPHAVLFNSFAFIIPAGDPARIREVADPVEAFARIARTRAPFIVNDIDGLKYIVETLWNAAGRPDKTGWYTDPALSGGAAMRVAAQERGYSIWGITPFLRSQRQQPLDLTALVLNDSLLQRIMGTVIVNPDKVPGINLAGATALQEYLLAPATQARIRMFRQPGIDQPLFWPAGRNNAADLLPGVR